MSFNELNSVEHYIIQKLSGVNLNAAEPDTVAEPATPYGSFPWKYVSRDELGGMRDESDVLVEPLLREALIRINPEIAENHALGRV
jgi:type I restriction enzyme R subunit